MAADTRGAVVALIGGAVAGIFAGWYDAYVVPTLQVRPGPAIPTDLGANTLPVGSGYVAVAAGVLILALLARRAHSRVVDVAYAVGGVSFMVVGLPSWPPALNVMGAPPLNALAVLGTAVLLIGLADLRGALWVRPHPSGANIATR